MKIFIWVFSIFAMGQAYAHPTAFEGSKGVMGYHSPLLNHVQLNYSFKYWLAMGVHHFDIPSSDGDFYANFVSTNFLLKRWNGDGFQANIYAVLGLGHSKFEEASRGAALTKLQFDIEDRDYYFLTSYSHIQSEERRELQDLILRAGFSPYVGAYDDIHTWLIFEWKKQIVLQDREIEDLTPFLRLFYKNLLFEIGQSVNGFTRFNYIIHF